MVKNINDTALYKKIKNFQKISYLKYENCQLKYEKSIDFEEIQNSRRSFPKTTLKRQDLRFSMSCPIAQIIFSKN